VYLDLNKVIFLEGTSALPDKYFKILRERLRKVRNVFKENCQELDNIDLAFNN